MSRRQTVFFLLVEPRNENHTGTEFIDFSVPRLAQSMHKAWKRHQDAVFWVDIDLAIKEGLTFYQTRSNAIVLQGTLPAHFFFQVERLKIGEKLCERQHLSPRPPPKIFLKYDLNWSLHQGSTVDIDQLANLFNSHLEKHFKLVLPSQPNSLNPLKIERGNPLPKRLLASRKENFVLQIERANL